MHTNSLKLMHGLLRDHASKGQGRTAYDVGSFDVNGTYREMVTVFGWSYVGLDIHGGPNVDVVIPEKDSWWPESVSEKAHLVISGQCMEHTRRPWEWILQVKQLLHDDGVLLLIVPSMWPQHKYPLDCWRVFPDGMIALADYANLNCLDSGLSEAEKDGRHQDCWAVMRMKP